MSLKCLIKIYSKENRRHSGAHPVTLVDRKKWSPSSVSKNIDSGPLIYRNMEEFNISKN